MAFPLVDNDDCADIKITTIRTYSSIKCHTKIAFFKRNLSLIYMETIDESEFYGKMRYAYYFSIYVSKKFHSTQCLKVLRD